MEKKHNWPRWLGAFLFAVGVITVYKTFDNLTNVFNAFMQFLGLLTPFIIGFTLSFFLYPACLKVESWLDHSNQKLVQKHSRTISILSVYFAFVAVLVVCLVGVVPNLSNSLADLLKRLPGYMEEIKVFLVNITSEGGLLEKVNLDEVINAISVENIVNSLSLTNIWQYVEGVKGVTSTLMSWFMGIVVCAYTLLERDSLFKMLRRVFGIFMRQETMDKVGFYVHQISAIFYKFFFGKAIDSLLIGIIAMIGFYFLGVPFAMLMGIFIMIFNMIPYFGPIIGAVPVVGITLVVTDVYKAIWTALFILVIQQFDAIVLGPKILGNSVGVSPFWVIFAIVVFGGLFGVWGMVFGVPAVAAIRMLLLDYLVDGKLNGTKTVPASEGRSGREEPEGEESR